MLPAKRARRLPVSPPTRSPASSTSTLAPMSSRMPSSRRAMAPSRLDRLAMDTRSRNSSFTRAALMIPGSARIRPPPRAGGRASAGSLPPLPVDGPSRPDEVEELAGVDREPIHGFLDGHALDLGHLFNHARAEPRPRRHALELSLVRPRRVALDEERFQRHCLDELAVPLAVHHLGADGDEVTGVHDGPRHVLRRLVPVEDG